MASLGTLGRNWSAILRHERPGGLSSDLCKRRGQETAEGRLAAPASFCANAVPMKAATTRRPLLPACAMALRMKGTRQRSAMNGQEAIRPISARDRARRPWRGCCEDLRDGGLDALVSIGDHQLDAIKGQEAFDPIGEAGAARRPRRAAHAGRAGEETPSRRSRLPLKGLLALFLSGSGSIAC